MGVPSFYRWLVNKYPKVVAEAIDTPKHQIRARIQEEEDASLPNPNGIEFDNLYMDMNAIIHPCFHPQDDNLGNPPTTFEQVFENVRVYIDKLFRIVRPRKLLYMAIDGVAPRGKMNQQRSRRYQTAKSNELAETEENRLRKEFEMEGRQVTPEQRSEVSDSNIITPGTDFMHQLSVALKAYINDKLKNDAAWNNIKVILSDASVPGEGEHKIMSFIRAQRGCPDYNPNTRHCLYGLDADLIMLALATHEVHFSILREDVLGEQQKPPQQNQQIGTGTMLAKSENSWLSSRPWFKKLEENKTLALVEKPYQFLHVWTLREYLELEFGMFDAPEKINMDFERYIDDFVFMCFFAGNDFLPHMPTLEIHEGAIDLLMHVYKSEFKNLGGYLTDMQWVGENKARYAKLKRIEKFILLVGGYEEKIFKKRAELRERFIKRILSEQADAKDELEEVELQTSSISNVPANKFDRKLTQDMDSLNICDVSVQDVSQNMKELKEKLQMCIQEKSDQFKNGNFMTDKVRLGTPGFKERYYKEKFLAVTKEDMENTRKSVVQKYTEGLCWVLVYYYSGVPSWTWFYPYHYGPFASDLKGLSQVNVNFQIGLPFKPFDQLMAVLPPKSAHALPLSYRELMTDEEGSKIIDFYPADFKVDADGKRFLWLAITKLPFINEERLLTETRKLEGGLTESETARNASRVDYLFVKGSNNLGTQILSLYQKSQSTKNNEVVKESMNTSLSGGCRGFLSVCKEVAWEGDPDGVGELVLCVFYELPDGLPLTPPRPLERTAFPDKILSEDDIFENELWHETQGNRPRSNRYQIEANQRRAAAENANSASSSRNSLGYGGVQKDAGSGWSYGRGRGSTTTTVSAGYSTGFSNSSNWGRGNSTVQPFVSRGGGRGLPYGVQTSRWEESKQPPHPSYQDGPSPTAVKSRLCNKFNTTEGCKFGDKCRFAHGEWELGKPSLPSHEDPRGMPPMGGGRYGGRMEPHSPGFGGAAASFGASATAKISVDASLAGAIIGKGGVNSKQICRLTGAKLSIRDHESDSNLKNIELEGTFDQIKQASAMVREVILNISANSGPPPPSRNTGGPGHAPAASNFKTKLCENFAKGSCTFGGRCHFAHGAEELQRRPEFRNCFWGFI